MKLRAALAVLVVIIASCGTANTGAGETDDGPEIMAAALVELITKDHTFGDGPPPFTVYLIQDHTDPSAGDPTAPGGQTSRNLTEEERNAIEGAVAEYGSVRWIDDPADWRTQDLMPTIAGAVILGVGEPLVDEDTALVPVSLWCSGLCGTWFTYRLDRVDGAWTVTGIEGPVAIS